MRRDIIEHIPHSSLKLPSIFKKQTKLISNDEINDFNFVMTDILTDKLFSCKRWTNVRAKISRIVCDTEKFLDDKDEVMSKFGLGAIYTKTNKGKNMFFPSDKYKNKVIKKFYLPYHEKLDRVVAKNLNKRTIILVDCHSFSSDIIMTKFDKDALPDICIGVNEIYSSQKLLDFTIEYFKSFGFSVSINKPYSGSMIPDFLLSQHENNFYSIMLEINKRLYLQDKETTQLQDNEKGNINKLSYYKHNKKSIIRSEKFKKLKEIIYIYLNFISIMELEDL